MVVEETENRSPGQLHKYNRGEIQRMYALCLTCIIIFIEIFPQQVLQNKQYDLHCCWDLVVVGKMCRVLRIQH